MKRTFDLFKATWTEFSEDKAQRLGAALAYYTVFSIAPLLLIAIAIAGFVFGREAAQGAIAAQLGSVMGRSTAQSINEMIANAARPKSGTIATIIGVVTLLMGAAGVFGQLKEALNTIWNVEKKPSGGLMALIRERFLSMAMVLGVGFLLLVTLVFDTAVAAMGKWIAPRVPGGPVLLEVAQLAVSFGIVTLLFALIFRFLPDARIEWHDVWFGAVFTSVLFVIGKFALGFYLGRGTIGSAYGAAGSLVIVLVWVYWSAQILFFGAEFTQVYSRTHGSHAGDTSKADAKAQAARVEDRPRSGGVPVAPRPAIARVRTANSGAAGKVAAGSALGLLLGALVGGVGTLVMIVRSARRLVTFR